MVQCLFVTIQRNPFLIFRRLPMRQFHKSQKMDVIFVGLKNNIFYKSLIISIICFTYSLNSYSQAAYKSPLLATDTWQVFYTLNTIE